MLELRRSFSQRRGGLENRAALIFHLPLRALRLCEIILHLARSAYSAAPLRDLMAQASLAHHDEGHRQRTARYFFLP